MTSYTSSKIFSEGIRLTEIQKMKRFQLGSSNILLDFIKLKNHNFMISHLPDLSYESWLCLFCGLACLCRLQGNTGYREKLSFGMQWILCPFGVLLLLLLSIFWTKYRNQRENVWRKNRSVLCVSVKSRLWTEQLASLRNSCISSTTDIDWEHRVTLLHVTVAFHYRDFWNS